MKQLNLKFKSTFKAFIVACIIVISDDSLFFGVNANSLFGSIKYASMIGLFLLIGIKLFFGAKHHQIKRVLLCCLTMCLLVLTTSIINDDLRAGYLYKVIILCLSCEVVLYIPFEEFILYFEKLLFFLAVISVICFGIAEINISIFSIFPKFYNTANAQFYNLGFCFVPITNNLRNYGLFREPGVYQMFLLIGLIFHVYFSNRVKVSKILVYILAIVLTFSTTGYLALVVFFVLYLFKENHSYVERKKKNFVLCILCLSMLIIATQTDILSADGIVFDKFSNIKRTTTIARLASVFANLKIWMQHPLFGGGLTEINAEFPRIAYEMYGKAVTHNTNTLLCELSTFGVIYTVLLMCGYLKFSKLITAKKSQRALILLIVFILSCGEKLTFSPIIYVLAFYGIDRKNTKE